MVKQAYGEEALSRTTTHLWFTRFVAGRESLEDDARSGRPVTAVTEENVQKVHAVLVADHRLTLRAISETLNIGKDTVSEIIHGKLNRRKVCARFVPHFLTADQKQRRMDCARDLVETADNDANFLKTIVTGDETWCFMYDPQTKRQSAAWLEPTDSKPTKVRQQKSRVKTMLIAFFDAKGMVHHEYLPVGQTVNATFYVEVLKRLVHRIRRIRPEYKEPGSWSLLHDNAPSHTANLVQKFLARNQISVISHPPYSPDISPPDYFLFPKLKIPMKGHFFEDVPAIQKACTEHLKSIPVKDFEKAFEALYKRCIACVGADGDYVEGGCR